MLDRLQALAAPGRLTAIDTLTQKVIATEPIRQEPKVVVYVLNAVPEGDGTQTRQRLGWRTCGAGVLLFIFDRSGINQAGNGFALVPTR